jgi:hypothetical protein
MPRGRFEGLMKILGWVHLLTLPVLLLVGLNVVNDLWGGEVAGFLDQLGDCRHSRLRYR